MEKNKKRFIVAAVAPVLILAGVLLYVSPFSANSETTAQQGWPNNMVETSMHGNGKGASHPHGDSIITTQNTQGMNNNLPHESWNKNSDDGSMRGNGRGRSSSHGSSNEQGQAGVSSHKSWDQNSNENLTRGKGRGRGSSHNSSDLTTQRGRGKGNFSSQNNQQSNLLPHENNEVPSQQWKDENKTESPTTLPNYTELIYT